VLLRVNVGYNLLKTITLLTKLMSDAMGRSLANVLFSAFGQAQISAGATAGADGRTTRVGSTDDLGTMLAYSHSVIIVPGYGLAVAQGQHAVRELADELEKRGVDVEYAIHPVAGRMPGHMNVLMAEAEVPYDKLVDLEDINDDFADTDLVLVVGANDVVNPQAKEEGDTPISGMPVLDVGSARRVVFIKRSLSPGFAGIDNPLFYDEEKTMMLFSDARQGLEEVLEAVKKS